MDFLKINEFEILKLNPSATVKVETFGNFESKVMIIDDFYSNPDAVLDFASKCPATSSREITYNSPGYRSQVTIDLTDIYAFLKVQLDLNFKEELDFFFPNFIHPNHFIINWISTNSLISETVPHFDPGTFAGLVYLNKDEIGGGTGIFRHIKTGFEFFPNNNFDITRADTHLKYVYFKNKIENIMQLRDLMFEDTVEADWELVKLMDFKFNRFVLYRSNLIHRAVVPSSSKDKLRITQGLFF